MSDSKRRKKPISKRKLKYIKAVANGATKKAAALQVGYSESVAENAKSHIETPDVRAVFAELVREQIPAKKIVARIKEGLDAKETKFFQFEGEVTDQRDVIAWTERRHYAALAAEFGGYHVPPQKEVQGSGTRILIQFVRDPQTPVIQVATKPDI